MPAKRVAAAKTVKVDAVVRDAKPEPDEPARSFWTDRRISISFLFLVLLLGGISVVTTTGLVQGRDNNVDLATQGEILHIIKDSVEPDGRRFQEGQARTAEAVGTINEITVLAAHCAHKHQGDLASIEVCVRVEYERRHPVAKP